MSEVFGNGALQEELLKALIGKVVDLSGSVKENVDQLRKITGGLEGVKGLDERMAGQEKRAEELIQKEEQVIDEIKKVADKIDLPAEKIEALEQALADHQRLFEKPLDKTVRYHHYVGKVVWVLAAMVVVTACSMGLAITQWQRAGRYELDQVRWRYVSLSVDSVVNDVVRRAEQWGLSDPGQFAKDVEQEEHRRKEMTKNMIREQTARKQIEDLERQKSLR